MATLEELAQWADRKRAASPDRSVQRYCDSIAHSLRQIAALEGTQPQPEAGAAIAPPSTYGDLGALPDLLERVVVAQEQTARLLDAVLNPPDVQPGPEPGAIWQNESNPQTDKTSARRWWQWR